jgi:hypothetical protein
VAACGGGSSAAKPKPPLSNTTAGSMVEEATANGQPRIEILSLGAEPREPLRLKPTVGSSSGADTDVSLDMHSQTFSSSIKMKIGWTGTVTNAGDPIRVEDRFDVMELNGNALEQSELSFRYTVLPTAAVASFEVLGEATPMETAAAESAKQSLSWLAVFPTAPVGIGARWRVETKYVQAGTPVSMTVTSELVAREGTHARIHGSMVFRSAPDVPAFAEGKGEIDVDFDLTRVVPSAKLTLVFNGELKGDTEAKVTGDSTMTLTPRP